MKLTQAREKFQKMRQDKLRIRVREHAYKDHPEREFDRDEILELINSAKGNLVDNRAATATAGSFVFKCKDDLERPCELVVLFEQDEATGEWLIVISAFRKV